MSFLITREGELFDYPWAGFLLPVRVRFVIFR